MDPTSWDERYAGTELVWSPTPNRFLVEQVADLPAGRALDLAAGEGRNAVWLAEQGWQVTAVDFSAVGLDKGRRLAATRGVEVDWVRADATTWDPPAAGFDLAVVLYLHLPPDERRQAHQRAAAAVAPGGTLLVIGHALENLDGGHGGPQEPAILLTADRVASDLQGTGVDVEVARTVERQVETEDGPRTAIDLLVRAGRG